MNLRVAKLTVCAALAAAALCDGGNLIGAYVISPTYPPGLAEELNSQLAIRTNGASSDFTGPRAPNNFFTAPPTNKPNFWLRDVTNILAQSAFRIQGGGMYSCADYLTCISPRFCVTANHCGGGDGTTNVWLLPSGTYYSNAVITSAEVGQTDMRISLMRSNNWTVCKILPDISSKIPFFRNRDFARFKPPVFVRFHQGIGFTNQFQTSFVSTMIYQGLFPSGWVPPYPSQRVVFGDYSQGDNWVGGDSSGAAYAVIAGEAVLVGTAFTPTYCPPLGLYTNEINAVMAALCASNGLPVETVTLYDLSQFPDL